MNVAILLSGCGVYDGAEIHESVLSMLALAERGATYQVFAPDKNQHHVVNHLTGAEMPETRNVLVESARIARGAAKKLADYRAADFDALLIPGGFGAAKNLGSWAFHGPEGEMDAEVKRAILETVEARKPIAALCIAPTLIAKALEGTAHHALLTVGTTEEPSSNEIAAVSAGIEKTGAKAVMKSIREIQVDEKLRLVTAPCYMMDANIAEVKKNIDAAVGALLGMLGQ